MVKNIFIIRHADANTTKNSLINDIDRTLSVDGIRDATKIGKCLYNENINFDKIITSSASRALHTGVIISRQTGFDVRGISVCEELYLASVEKIIEKIQSCDNNFSTIGIIAHNPGVSELAFLTEQFINVSTSGILHYQAKINNWRSLTLDNLDFVSYICTETINT